MKALINGDDITKYIITDTYEVNTEQSFESWVDGNKVEHRVYTSEKVVGSFNVVLTNKNGMPISDFLELWNEAVNNHIVTLSLHVLNLGAMRTINAFYSMENVTHEKLADGSFLDVLKIEIKER